ncbi:ComF family protein [Chitinophaga pendula]|uniref:ComF family protein n=1 Tax=Chitinophaga TaxID=79328 RepID=UPI000BAFE31C|nr:MULTISPECIES: ComF family protein [Chitinophaga]ASZ10489.1 phosphoribosyltransferase [Chitinophaga sp. MD30]UCJ06539.1 ComF family protein [Chitinophaga pendula]
MNPSPNPMQPLVSFYRSLVHLFYPHCCEICGQDLTDAEEVLCLTCLHQLPATQCLSHNDHPAARIFQGRINVQHAAAIYYYIQPSPLQQLVYQFKYHQRQDIARYMGRQMGLQLLQFPWIQEITAIVPVPLHRQRQRQRGYNQSALLANGIAAIIQQPVKELLYRSHFKHSQTKHNRETRWQNVTQAFHIKHPATYARDHFLLVDDIITTGATTEACCLQLLKTGANVSICSLAMAVR